MTPGEIIEYEITATDIAVINAPVSVGEKVQLLVTEADDDTGVYGGYLFLPGGAGIPYLRVDPAAPAAVTPIAAPTMADLYAEIKGDPEMMEFLTWKLAKDQATDTPDTEPGVPVDNPDADPPVPDSTTPTFTPPPGDETTAPTPTQQGE